MGFCFMFLWWNLSIRLFLHGVKWGSENSTHEIRTLYCEAEINTFVRLFIALTSSPSQSHTLSNQKVINSGIVCGISIEMTDFSLSLLLCAR